MPKQRTRRGARKRLKITGTGKLRRAKAFKSHILTKKHPKRKRGLRQTTSVSDADMGRLRRLVPYLRGN